MLEVGESWSRAKLGSVVTVAGLYTITREAVVAKEHAPRLDWRMHFTEPWEAPLLLLQMLGRTLLE